MKFTFFKKEFWLERVDYPIKRWQQFLDVVLTSLLLIAICLLAFFRGAEWHKTYGAEENTMLLSATSFSPISTFPQYSLNVTGLVNGDSSSSRYIRVYYVPAYTIVSVPNSDYRYFFVSLINQSSDIQLNYNLAYDSIEVFRDADSEFSLPYDWYMYTTSSSFRFIESTPTVTPSPTFTPVPDVPPVEVGEYDKYFLLLIFLLGGLLVWNFATRSPN